MRYRTGSCASGRTAGSSPTDFDPIVDLVVQLGDESRVPLRTIVSKLRVPRAGEEVRLLADPRQPGAYLYAGVADA